MDAVLIPRLMVQLEPRKAGASVHAPESSSRSERNNSCRATTHKHNSPASGLHANLPYINSTGSKQAPCSQLHYI